MPKLLFQYGLNAPVLSWCIPRCHKKSVFPVTRSEALLQGAQLEARRRQEARRGLLGHEPRRGGSDHGLYVAADG